jgi:DNA mismatch repair protein MutL
MESGNGPSQQSLFPQVLELGAADFETLKDIIPDIRSLGFDLQEFGQNTFVIHGTPADIPAGDEKRMIEKLLEQFKNNQSRLTVDKRDNIIRALARSNAVRNGNRLDRKEMKQLVDELFACEKPFLGIDGKPTVVQLGLDEIDALFKK